VSDCPFKNLTESFLETDLEANSKPFSQLIKKWDGAVHRLEDPSSMVKLQDLARGGPCPELLNLRFKRLAVASESEKISEISMDAIKRWVSVSNVEEKSHD
jgi:hypothetical protein